MAVKYSKRKIFVQCVQKSELKHLNFLNRSDKFNLDFVFDLLYNKCAKWWKVVKEGVKSLKKAFSPLKPTLRGGFADEQLNRLLSAYP